MTSPIRVAIADDHALFRQGLRLLLDLHDDIEVVGETAVVDEVAGILEASPCDILLLDLQMDRSAMIDIRTFVKHCRVILVTASETPDQAIEALRAGASGIVLKRFASETLMQAIRAVAAGRLWTPPSLAPELAAEVRRPNDAVLTPREVEVVRYVALGLRNAEVARKLFISEQTVKAHLNNVFQKVGVRDRVELAMYAVRRGIVSVDETET